MKTVTRHPLGARVAMRRSELGLSQEKLADAIGMKQQGIASIEKGEVRRPRQLRELSEALHSPIEWLLDGEGPKEIDGDHPPSAAENPRPKHGIIEIDVRAGMGGGGSVDQTLSWQDGQFTDPVKAESWRFPERFMREELRAPESRVLILETQGDSMSPTILAGDRVIVDTGHRIPSPDGIYAIRDRYGSIVVKRLQTLRRGDPPILKVISDNPHHDSEEVSVDDIAIVGRVLWSLKRL